MDVKLSAASPNLENFERLEDWDFTMDRTSEYNDFGTPILRNGYFSSKKI